jgi:hypothetical protein
MTHTDGRDALRHCSSFIQSLHIKPINPMSTSGLYVTLSYEFRQTERTVLSGTQTCTSSSYHMHEVFPNISYRVIQSNHLWPLFGSCGLFTANKGNESKWPFDKLWKSLMWVMPTLLHGSTILSLYITYCSVNNASNHSQHNVM